jgi:hypothetical protein
MGAGKRFRLRMTSDNYELSPIFMQLRRAIILFAAFVNAYLRSFINERS